MFANFLSRLTAEKPAPLHDSEANLALAAVMVRIARADGNYDATEIQVIDQILQARFELDAAGATHLRTQAEVLEAEAPDTVRFTKAIKGAVPYEDRINLVRALWQVALADGDRDAAENSQMRVLVSLLGVSDQDSAVARQSAQG
ncbi:MAG: TerB family tellurite resistance protein [Planktomarina sp.]